MPISLYRVFILPVACLGFLSFAAGQSPAAGQTAQLPSFAADLSFSAIARGDRPARDMDGKVYFGHDHRRIETQGGPRGPSVILTDLNTKITDILLPAQGVYVERKADEMAGRSPGMMARLRPLQDPGNPCAGQEGATCKNVGVEDVNGRPADHWQITDKGGKVANTWIDQKLHFPIKSVTEDGTWELSNIKEGELDASLFQIPAGYKKMDMSNNMGGMGVMQGGPPQQ